MPPLEVRRIALADELLLARLHAACFPRSWQAEEFRALLASGAEGLVSSGKGFVLFRHAAGEAEILTLAVDPSARRKSIAQALLKEMEKRLVLHGVTDIFLEVAEDNAAARALYEKAGFTPAGARKAYYAGETGALKDALMLVKRLHASSFD